MRFDSLSHSGKVFKHLFYLGRMLAQQPERLIQGASHVGAADTDHLE